MSEPGHRFVCDLTLVMRTRLVCGMYSRRVLPPRWRRLAQAYCLTLAVVFSCWNYIEISMSLVKVVSAVQCTILVSDYVVSVLISLWTGDEYIYSYFTQCNLTDVTLDSRVIFDRLQKQMKVAYIFAYVFYVIVYSGLSVAAWHVIGLEHFMKLVFPWMIHDVCSISIPTTKLLVMGLFNARMLVLKRRLQRHGFRTVGRAPPQQYCQIYDEIWQGLETTDNPLKLLVSHCLTQAAWSWKDSKNTIQAFFYVLLFFDLIFACSKIIAHVLIGQIRVESWQDDNGSLFATMTTYYYILIFMKTLACAFGYVMLLESAAAHCEDMAVFTGTQLIKNPTAAERRRMHEFLRALERRGARYRILRALPLDARFVLRVLGFCFAQIIVFANNSLNYDY